MTDIEKYIQFWDYWRRKCSCKIIYRLPKIKNWKVLCFILDILNFGNCEKFSTTNVESAQPITLATSKWGLVAFRSFFLYGSLGS